MPGSPCRKGPTGRGPLDGLTFAVKDLIDVAGWRTGGGNPHWLNSRGAARESAAVVDILLRAGARLAGKTVTDELAFGLEGHNAHYGTPINPACPDRLPGGSSSGSAVAVAAGIVDFALGTDTGGSIRIPASFTGIFGFRPSHGVVPADGVMPFAPSYDTVGWFARDAGTLARVGALLLPRREIVPVRKLLVSRDAWALAEPPVAAALRGACERLGSTEEVDIFEGGEREWRECYRVLQGAEIWQHLGPWISRTRPALGKAVAARFADAAAITPHDVDRHLPRRATISTRLRNLLSAGTGLLLPTAPCVAPPRAAAPGEISELYRRALALTSMAGHAGLPQLSIPVAHVGGCPIGLSIVGGIGADHDLLAFAAEPRSSPAGVPRLASAGMTPADGRSGP